MNNNRSIQDVKNEITFCKKRTRYLLDEVGKSKDFDSGRAALEEIKSLASRESELTELKRKMILEEMKVEKKAFVEMMRRLFS